MIEAKNSRLARAVFNPYVNRLLKKSFSHFYIVNNPPEIPNDESLIITPNHVSWWDGFFIDKVHREFVRKNIHLMMLKEQLRRYWFFKFLGAFSINIDRHSSHIQTVKYIRNLTENCKNSVVIYPQGEIEAFERRPLSIKEGLKVFIGTENVKLKILPIGFKIHYYNEKFPAVVARFGELIDSDSVVENFDNYNKKFIENLDDLAEAAYRKDFLTDLFFPKRY